VLSSLVIHRKFTDRRGLRVDLEGLLSHYQSSVDERKLGSLRLKFAKACAQPLCEVSADDPVHLLTVLARHLQSEGATQGSIHSISQFFMGLIRRAAVEGIMPPPPEGPWTRDWQRLISATEQGQRVKLTLRSLAAWATTRGLSPGAVGDRELRDWIEVFRGNPKVLDDLRDVLAGLNHEGASVDSLLLERLRRKAKQGTVKDEMHLW
jgi:hypothetical protein